MNIRVCKLSYIPLGIYLAELYVVQINKIFLIISGQ